MASIVQRGKAANTYAVTYYTTTWDGRQKKEWISGLTKEEAKIKKREIEIAIAKGGFVMPANITVDDFVKDFVQKVAKKRWKQTTYTTNTALLRNHVLPYIGKIKLKDLKAYQITEMFAILEKKPTNMNNKYRPKGHALSSTTLRHIFVLLQEILTRAVKWELIEKSPMPPDEDKPKRAKVDNPIWTKELFQQAIREIEHPMLRLGVHLAFATSCREGEMLALTRDCIDLERGKIVINKALKRVTLESIENAKEEDVMHIFPQQVPGSKSVLVLASTKTSVERDANLTDQLKVDILELYAWHDRNAGFHDGYENNNMLFAQECGEPVTQNLMAKWFRKFIERSGGRYPSIPFKNIRHSSATYKMQISGFDAPTVAGETGHADLQVLLGTYVQRGDDARRRELMRKFQEDFYGEETPEQTTGVRITDNPALEKLFTTLDDENRELLLHALIGASGTQYKNI